MLWQPAFEIDFLVSNELTCQRGFHKLKHQNQEHQSMSLSSTTLQSTKAFAWFVISNSSIHWMSTWTVLLCHCQSGIHKSQHNLHQPMPITPPSQSMKFDVMKTFIWLFSNLHLWCCHQICSPIYSVDLVDDHCLWFDFLVQLRQ